MSRLPVRCGRMLWLWKVVCPVPDAPKERLVEQHSGSVAPTSMAGALVLCEHLAAERDKAVKEKDEWRFQCEAVRQRNEELLDELADAIEQRDVARAERDTALAKASQ